MSLRAEQTTLLLTRLALGWLMFYAGFSKIINPDWSAKGYLLGAKTFSGFYAMLASDTVVPYINFINKWSLLLLGISLIAGVFIKISGRMGALLMLLYYFPALAFPKTASGFLIDDHIVYALFMLYLAAKASSPLADWQKIRKMTRL